MSSVLIVYYSRTGHTKEMAEIIARGAQEEGAKVDLKPVDEVKFDILVNYDAIILGSPDYYGTMASEIKKLIDDSISIHGQLEGKIGGAFSSAANIGGGNETTILSILQGLLVHGMIIPGVAKGDHYGPVSINSPDERAIRQSINYGKLIAKLAAKLK
ncbi:flavodoxin domain-containing protein [bacterium]|nr:flavodoxin domain-containing protein [bacterium]